MPTIAPPTPPPQRLNKFRRALGRYLRDRREDVLGRSDTRADARRWIERMIDDLNERPVTGAASSANPLPATWAEAVARAGLTATDLRRQYEIDARLARALLAASAVSLLIFAHRAGLTDWAGTSASLGMAFTLTGLALAPAYRCWRISARTTLAARRWFLRHPTAWWPYPLPDDYQP